jgi:hypothetical protein
MFKVWQKYTLCKQYYKRKDVYVIKGPFMQNGWGMREKFKSIRVILQKVVSVVKL